MTVMDETATGAPTTAAASGGDLPDTALFWRWVGAATRPVVGWILVAVGALVILLGYVGVANQALVAKQLPYLISGGIGGIAIVAVGTYFLGTEEIRRDSGRLDRLERMVAELHGLLLTTANDSGANDSAANPAAARDSTAGAAIGTRPDADPTDARNGNGSSPAPRFRALPDGERFHRNGCAALEGKTGVTTVSTATIRRRNLTPCPLCEPVPADA